MPLCRKLLLARLIVGGARGVAPISRRRDWRAAYQSKRSAAAGEIAPILQNRAILKNCRGDAGKVSNQGGYECDFPYAKRPFAR